MPDENEQNQITKIDPADTNRWVIEAAIVIGIGLYVCFILFKPSSDSSMQSMCIRVGILAFIVFGVYRSHPSNVVRIPPEEAAELSRGASLAGWLITCVFFTLFAIFVLAFSGADPHMVDTMEGNLFRMGVIGFTLLILYVTYPKTKIEKTESDAGQSNEALDEEQSDK